MLSGYKTYVICGLAVLSYLGHYAVGDATLSDTINAILPYIVGTFLRHGVAKIEG